MPGLGGASGTNSAPRLRGAVANELMASYPGFGEALAAARSRSRQTRCPVCR